MSIVKVIAKVVDDDSDIKTEVPVLLDENNHVLKSLLNFTLKLKRDGRSQTKLDELVSSVRLLLEYMNANESGFDNPKKLFESFSSRLFSGTIGEEGLDPSGLYWLPFSKQVANKHIHALTQLTDWLDQKQGLQPLNPLMKTDSYTERLNYAAWFRRNQHDFLGHIKDKHINQTVRLARSIQGKKPLGGTNEEAIEFPEGLFERFYLEGFGETNDIRAKLRDQLILILMHGGGLRESEALHLWFDDVLVDPHDAHNVIVRIYHPVDGKAPNNWKSRTGKTTRAAYIKERYGLTPRTELLGKQKVGWKGRTADHKDNYIQVHWFPKEFGYLFAKLWQDYIRLAALVERHHPYAFVSFHSVNIGSPYTLNAFHDNYARALKRIGLKPNKNEGLSPHSHRHSYGRRLMRTGVHSRVIQKALHHSSPESQVVYTSPNLTDVTNALNQAQHKLKNPDAIESSQSFPSWEKILELGFEDIDPSGLYSGKNPKLGRK